MSPTVKNWTIGILLSLVLIQTWMLIRNNENTAHTLSLDTVVVDSVMRTTIHLQFSAPVPQATRDMTPPATMVPAVAGQWVWTNPYTLKFLAQTPLPLDMEYALTLAEHAFPESLLHGERTVTVRTGTFAVQECTLTELASDAGPDMVELEGQLVFNGPVDPETLLPALRLLDDNGTTTELMLQTQWRSTSLGFRSLPLRKTSRERTLTLEVAPTLTMAEKTLSLGKPFTQKILLRLDPVLRVTDVKPLSEKNRSRIVLEFSAPVAAGALRECLRLTPDTDVLISTHGRTATISGPSDPGASWTLILRQGLRAEDNAVLEQDYTAELHIPDLPPGVDFAAKGMFLPKQGRGLLEVEHVNLDALELTVSRVFPNNLCSLLQDYGYSVFEEGFVGDSVPYHLGSEIHRERISLSSPPNVFQTQTLAMSDLLPEGRPGMYKISLALPSEYKGATRWVLRTDIGLVTKKEHDGYLVWANSIATLQALSGLEIKLVSSKNQILGSARTDEQGLARIPFQHQSGELGHPALILAESGEDFSFISLDRFRINTTGLDVSGAFVSTSGLMGYVYGKRDIYRPGETLDGVVLVRDAHLGIPPDQPVLLEQQDPEGRTLRTLTVRPDAGMANFSLDIPEWSLTGPYSLRLVRGGQMIGEYTYQVEEFVPDRINVEITDTPETARAGERLAFVLSSRYLFGPPAEGLSASARVRLHASTFSPKGFEHFAFGDPGRSFEPVTLLDTTARLDASGHARFETLLPEGLNPPLILEAELRCRVSEQGGRGVTARRRLPVHVHGLYPGIKRLSSQELEPGKPTILEFVTLSPEGKQILHPEMTVTVFQDQWQTVMRHGDNGFSYESVRRPVEISTQRIAPGPGAGNFSIVPPEYGSYRVRLAVPGGAAVETDFYCGGWGYSPWAIHNPARLELVPNKNGYRAGETASVQIRAPFSGKVLVSVEGRNVEHHQIIQLTGNTGQLFIPIREEWQPNVHLTATLVRRGKDIRPGTPGRAFGAIPLFVNSLNNNMPVTVDVPAETRPETELPIRVTTAPHARLTVAVVDEGVLQLAGGANPDPFAHFYAKRGLEVESFDNFALLFPHVLLSRPLTGGGAYLGGASSFMRTEGIRRAKPVTFWSGILTADSSGRITHSVQLPAFQGALRVVAVANTGKSFGTGTALTRVRTPLVLMPTLPRFLGLGDQVDIPITIRNDTPTAGIFQLNATVEGPARLGAMPPTLSLDSGRERTVYLQLRGGDVEGTVRLRLTASGNGELLTVTENIDQRSPLPVVRTMTNGILTEEQREISGPAPQTLFPDTVRRSVRVATQPLLRFSGHLENLLLYPHGCAEQTASKAFPLLYFGALAEELAPKAMNTAGPSGLVHTAIRRLHTMQTSSGGYAWWPGNREPDPWVSVYVCHFLLEARQAGHTIPLRMLDRGLDYLQTLANPTPESSPDQIEQAAYALFVLALGERADLGGQEYLQNTFGDKLPGLARTLLAGALLSSDKADAGYTLLHTAPDLNEKRRDHGGNLGSTLRDRAFIALILQRHLPDDPRLPGLMTRLSEDVGQRAALSTQEASLALMALGKYLTRQDDKRPFAGELTWENDRLDIEETRCFVARDIATTSALALRKEPADRDVFYSVLTAGAPRPDAHEPSANGLEIEQTLLDDKGQILDLDVVPQGALVVLRTKVRSTSGPIRNVVVQSLLPAGLEVENPRLATTEKLDWMPEKEFLSGHQDLRDDRILVFTDMKDESWNVGYSVLRAVLPGQFLLPPAQAEAMYAPELRATGPVNAIRIVRETTPTLPEQ